MKLKKQYKTVYGEDISSWKIQKVIEEEKLYFDYIQQKKEEKTGSGKAEKADY